MKTWRMMGRELVLGPGGQLGVYAVMTVTGRWSKRPWGGNRGHRLQLLRRQNCQDLVTNYLDVGATWLA